MSEPRTVARFVWPPRPVDVPAPAKDDGSVERAPAPAAATARAPWKEILDEIERVWLGRITPPLESRLAEAGWTPDPPEAFCPRCATSAGAHEADDTGCSSCRGRPLPWERAIRLGEYAGVLRELILEVKFTRWRRLGDRLGRMLGATLAQALEDARIDRHQVVLVPVPMSFRSRVARGVDHALVIARGVSAATGLPMVRALSRRHRPSQRSTPRTARAANVAGAFRALPAAGELCGRVVVVIDDVRTTGATLSAACRALSAACKPLRGNDLDTYNAKVGVRLWTAVAGVTPEPGRRLSWELRRGSSRLAEG